MEEPDGLRSGMDDNAMKSEQDSKRESLGLVLDFNNDLEEILFCCSSLYPSVKGRHYLRAMLCALRNKVHEKYFVDSKLLYGV